MNRQAPVAPFTLKSFLDRPHCIRKPSLPGSVSLNPSVSTPISSISWTFGHKDQKSTHSGLTRSEAAPLSWVFLSPSYSIRVGLPSHLFSIYNRRVGFSKAQLLQSNTINQLKQSFSKQYLSFPSFAIRTRCAYRGWCLPSYRRCFSLLGPSAKVSAILKRRARPHLLFLLGAYY